MYIRLSSPLIISIVFLLSFNIAPAQVYEGPYRSAENPHYWKLKNEQYGGGYWQQDVEYDIKAELNDETEIITGSLSLEYHNNSPHELDRMYFRLYQNAFQPESELHNVNLANKVKPKFGKYEAQKKGTTVSDVKVAGIEADVILDGTILRIIFKNGKTIKPNSSVKVQMSFKTHFDAGDMRRRMKRFDHSGVKHFDGVLWYPRVCVYDKTFGWHVDQHLGKEFFGNFGSFKVELTLPSNYVVEATGRLQNPQEAMPQELYEKIKIENYKPTEGQAPYRYEIPRNGTKTWKYYAVNVHDFAWTADPSYRIGKAIYNGIECIALAQEQNAHTWQPTAKFVSEVVRIYSEDFGAYIYPKMVAADARDGMEYPMITLNGGNWPGHKYVIAHEVGHNWFYGMLGTNETYRAFMDEGFTQFLTTWSLKKINKDEKLPNAMDERYLYGAYLQDALNRSDPPLNTHSDDFSTALGHGGGYRNVYYKTATMLSNLQYVLGDELFLKAMQHYVEKWKIRHPYPQDFREAITERVQTDLTWFFDQWLETTKSVDYSIQQSMFRNKDKAYKITLVRKGEMQMPIDLLVTTKAGNKVRYHIPNTYFIKDTSAIILPQWRGWGGLNKVYKTQILVPGNEKIKRIEIDTSGRLADINRIDNNTQGITKVYLNKGKEPVSSFNTYHLGIRPDVWWNPIDGTKVGVNFKSDYVKKKYMLDFTVWYNSGLGSNESLSEGLQRNSFSTYFSSILDYKSLIGKDAWFYYHNRLNDGIIMDLVGVSKAFGQNEVNIYAKAFGTYLDNNLYFHQTALVGQPEYRHAFAGRNNTLNLNYTRNYKYFRGNGKTQISLRTPSLYTEFFYYGLQLESVNHNKVLKTTLRTRFFAAFMGAANNDISQIPLESKLFLAGANFEEMLDNKFTRTSGFVPADMLWNGTSTGNFQMGGGLNLRGYTGYLAPAPQPGGNPAEYIFAGTRGTSFSAEFDLDDYIRFQPRKIRNFLKADIYLFGDAGFLAHNVFEYGVANDPISAPFRMDAGIGSAFTIKRWGKRNAIKPFTLRFDLPIFLNRPPAGQDFFAFRWLVGIGRSF